MTYFGIAQSCEHYSATVDLVNHEDGTWRADEFNETTFRSSVRDDYPSREALLVAMNTEQPSEFWESWD